MEILSSYQNEREKFLLYSITEAKITSSEATSHSVYRNAYTC